MKSRVETGVDFLVTYPETSPTTLTPSVSVKSGNGLLGFLPCSLTERAEELPIEHSSPDVPVPSKNHDSLP